MPKRLMIQCATVVNKDAVSRKTIDGVEHIIVSSSTLPDNIVMNDILYPAEEIKAGFESLERTLAPVEHPVDADGMFISASDPIAIHNFHAGAFNTNVRRVNGRVRIDKTINVQEALKSDRGKRLLERVEELETNDKPRPIHTSVGVFIELEELDKPQTEHNGIKTNAAFTAIARKLVFDHDAILLDSVAAATPRQGVGMAVNAAGDKIDFQHVIFDNALGDDELSHSEIWQAISAALDVRFPENDVWVSDIFDSAFVFHRGKEFFQADYRIVDGQAEITTNPVEVIRDVTFIVKTNGKKGDAMKKAIVNALKKKGIEIEGLDDDKLLAAYNQMLANDKHDDDEDEEKRKKAEADKKAAAKKAAANADDDPIVASMNKALEPLVARLDSMETKLNQSDTDEVETLAKIVGDSALYPNLDMATAKVIPIDKLKELAANCKPAHGINAFQANRGAEDGYSGAYDMPE